jgi:hypothetical protein
MALPYFLCLTGDFKIKVEHYMAHKKYGKAIQELTKLSEATPT